MDRLFTTIFGLVVVESAWALFCAVAGVDLFLYFAGLIVASAAFWVPGLLEQKR
jgi:hypothetical protein